jgi:hypothetical protein
MQVTIASPTTVVDTVQVYLVASFDTTGNDANMRHNDTF